MTTNTNPTDKSFVPCPRCDGTGYTPFLDVAAGICFRCEGAGGEWISTSTAARRQRDRARREAKRQAAAQTRQAEIAERHAAVAAAHPELVARLRSLAAAETEQFGCGGVAAEAYVALRDGQIDAAEAERRIES